MAGKGILLDKDGDLLIQNKSLVVGDSILQEVAIILQSNQGDSKFDPLLGANLTNLVKRRISKFTLIERVKIQLALDNKDYENVKHLIETKVKT